MIKFISSYDLEKLKYEYEFLKFQTKFLKKELEMFVNIEKGNYTRKPLSCLQPEDTMTVESFLNEFPYGHGSDGSAYPMKDGLEDVSLEFNKDCLWRLPKDATHISWYNK